ncbi:DMT family transporter [Mesorhizobium sp. ZMM04-5]|uniref:DMT family transporter n=1 Tax=Mesorhizobium marinum TaxID=3228790 RepID=A0ABV3QY61_9HYPH
MTEGRPGAPRTAMIARLAMLAYALIIAGSFSFGALAAPHVPSSVLNLVRFLAAFLLMAALLRIVRGPLKVPVAPWRFLLLGGLMGAYFVLMFIALQLTDPVSTSAVFTLIPFMAAGFGFLLLGQRTHPVVLAGLMIAAAGALWVIFRGEIARLSAFHVSTGGVIFFIGCACQALYAPLVRLLSRGESVFEFTVWTLLGCTLCLLPFAIPQLAETDWAGLNWVVWGAIAYLVIFATAISFFLLQYASMHLPSAKVFPYAYLTPSFVIVLEAGLGHGLPSLAIVAGAALTVLGLLVILLGRD